MTLQEKESIRCKMSLQPETKRKTPQPHYIYLRTPHFILTTDEECLHPPFRTLILTTFSSPSPQGRVRKSLRPPFPNLLSTLLTLLTALPSGPPMLGNSLAASETQAT